MLASMPVRAAPLAIPTYRLPIAGRSSCSEEGGGRGEGRMAVGWVG